MFYGYLDAQTTKFLVTEFVIPLIPTPSGTKLDEHELSFRKLILILVNSKSRDSSVGIALGYGLDDRGSGIRLPAGAGNFSLHHRVQNDSGAHPASYPMGTRGSFPRGKAAGA
jgi:hypothetical protein